MKRNDRNRLINKPLTYRGDIRVFYQLILDHLKNEEEGDIANINPRVLKKIFEKFQSTPGTTQNLRLGALVDHYRAKILSFNGNRFQRIQQLEKWYEEDGYKLPEKNGSNDGIKKPKLASSESASNSIPNCNPLPELSTLQETREMIFLGKSFCLINFLFNDVGKVFMRAAKTLILAYGGILVEEDDLDVDVYPSCFVINFGPVKGEIMEFLDIHKIDLYLPSLIFSSVQENNFENPKSHISFQHSLVRKSNESNRDASIWWCKGNDSIWDTQNKLANTSDKVAQTVVFGLVGEEGLSKPGEKSSKQKSTQTDKVNHNTGDRVVTTEASTETETLSPIPADTSKSSTVEKVFQVGQTVVSDGNNACTRQICGKQVHFQIYCDDSSLQRCLINFGDKAVARQMRTILYMAEFATTSGEDTIQAIADGAYQNNNYPLKQMYKKLSLLIQDVHRFLAAKGNVTVAKTMFPEISEPFWTNLGSLLEAKKSQTDLT